MAESFAASRPSALARAARWAGGGDPRPDSQSSRVSKETFAARAASANDHPSPHRAFWMMSNHSSSSRGAAVCRRGGVIDILVAFCYYSSVYNPIFKEGVLLR
jgi:hypothetical protein